MCSFIGAQAQIEVKGGRNPLVELAAQIDILGQRDAELDELRGERVADRVEDDPRFSRVAADPEAGVEAANSSGSMEAFVSMFGGGR